LFIVIIRLMLLLFLCPKVIIIHNKHHMNLIDRSNNDAVHNRDVVLGGLAAKAEMDEQHPDVVLRNDPTAGLDLDQVRADEARAERDAAERRAAPDVAEDDAMFEGFRRILEDIQRMNDDFRRRREDRRRRREDRQRRREDRRNLRLHGQAPPPPPPAPQPAQAPPPPPPAP
jgi:hypothetical protein